MTVAELQTKVLADAFPSGCAPENLEGILRDYVITALIEIQRGVLCFQKSHTNIIPATGAFWQCGTSVVDLPRGKILRVYTVQDRTGQGKEWCEPVPYTPIALRELRRYQSRFTVDWRNRFYVPQRPTNLPLGFNLLDWSSDAISGRAMSGRYAIDAPNFRIVVAPWLQTYEALVIEWQGIKRQWAPLDGVPEDPDFVRLVRLFVEREYGRRWGCEDLMVREGAYREALADMIVTCKEELETHGKPATPEEIDKAFLAWWSGPVSLEEIHRAVEPEASAAITAVGDSGNDSPAAVAVAAMLTNVNADGWHLTLGDNVYQPLSIPEALTPYQNWIEKARLRLVLGNHDLDAGDLGATQIAYVGNQPVNSQGNSRWYSVVIGPVEFFVVDSGVDTAGHMVEPDGNWEGSLQHQQIQAAVLRSQARWRVVALHHAPFTSSAVYSPGLAVVRWVSSLPVHAVLSGHAHIYERLKVANRTHIVAGTGGAELHDFTDPPLPESQVRLKQYGALLIQADCDQLCITFLDQNGVVADKVCITDPEAPPVPRPTAVMYHGRSDKSSVFLEADVLGWLPNTRTDRQGDYSFTENSGAGGYCCFAIPESFGSPQDTGLGEGFRLGSFPCAMGRPDTSPPFGAWDSGYGTEKITVAGKPYRIYRTAEKLNGSVVIRIN